MQGRRGAELNCTEAKLEELYQGVGKCHLCSISSFRRVVVPGEGSLSSGLMIIAQAPNRQEMESGKVFTGPSGKVLDELLSAGGYTRKDFFLTNLLKCPLPHCRKPLRAEIGSCLPFLRREMELVDPTVLIPLGRYAIKTILNEFGHPVPPRNSEIPFLFGRVFRGGGHFVIPLPHPSSVLYRPSFRTPSIELYKRTLSLVGTLLAESRQ